jgi:hypothetical protein
MRAIKADLDDLGSQPAHGGEHSRPALAPLIEMLTDPRPAVCHNAVWALGEIGLAEPEVLTALQSACEHPDERVHTASRQALVTVWRGPRRLPVDLLAHQDPAAFDEKLIRLRSEPQVHVFWHVVQERLRHSGDRAQSSVPIDTGSSGFG